MIIQNNHSKLSKAIAAYLAKNTECSIKLLNIQSDIYKIHFLHQQETKYLFHASSINNAIFSFINEYASKYQIYLYHDTEYLNPVSNLCHNIVPYNKNLNLQNVISIGHIINNISFYPISKTSSKITSCAFLNNHHQASEHLYSLCKNNNIVLFDSTVPSVYNLGTTTEEEKNTILNNCKAYIDITNEYGPEAQMLGCDVLCFGDDRSLQPISYKNITTINHFITDIIKA